MGYPAGVAVPGGMPAGIAMPSGVVAPYGTGAAVGTAPARGRRRKVVRDVRNRRVVRRLDILSVLKVSLLFYFCVLVVLVVAGAVLWDVAVEAGVIKSLDKLVKSLFALSSFQLHPVAALEWGTAVVGGACLIGVLVNVLAAILYNLISDLVGGIQVTVVDNRDDLPSPPAAGQG